MYLFIFIKGWRDTLSIFFTTDQITKCRCRQGVETFSPLCELKRKYRDFQSGAQFAYGYLQMRVTGVNY